MRSLTSKEIENATRLAGYVRTDDYQFQKQLGIQKYHMIGAIEAEGGFLVYDGIVDLNDYNEKEKNDMICFYGYQLEKFAKDFPDKSVQDGLIAEMFFETNFLNYMNAETVKSVDEEEQILPAIYDFITSNYKKIINKLGYENIKECIPFTLDELRSMYEKDYLMDENQEEWNKAAGYVTVGNIPSILVGSKLVELCLRHKVYKLGCSALVDSLKECARMWIKEEKIKNLIAKTQVLEKKQSTLIGSVRDADTVLVDILECQDYEYSGFAQDIFNIWKNSADKEAVEQMFYVFTGMPFTEYLQKAITVSHISISANQMTDVVSEWLKQKSIDHYRLFMGHKNIVTDTFEHTLEMILPGISIETESNKAEFFGILIDTVEDFLEEHGVKTSNIPCEDRNLAIEDGEDPEELAIIYGEDYDYLADQFAEILSIKR